MSYNRRTSGQSRPSREEDAHLTSPTTAGMTPLSPPRPFFHTSRNANDRGSYSSADTVDTSSDSEQIHMSPSQQQQQQQTPASPTQGQAQQQVRQRNQKRRSLVPAAGGYALVDQPDTPGATPRDPFATPGEAWSPTTLYEGGPGSSDSHGAPSGSVRGPGGRSAAPPSAFAFPFQAHPGNPDPGMSIPGTLSRRSSMDSIRRPPSAGAEYSTYPPNSPGGGNGYNHLGQASPSATDLHYGGDLGRPQAPFMAGSGEQQQSPSNSRRTSMHSEVYSQSAGAAIQSSPNLGGGDNLPRVSSVSTFRAPFLSPASRPGSSFWAPPSYPYGAAAAGGSGSAVGLTLGKRAPMPSSRLASKLTKDEKPWLDEKDKGGRISWWLTVIMTLVGLGAGAVLVWRGYTEAKVFKDKTCVKYQRDFSKVQGLGDDWNYDSSVGGFGNGEFEATRQDPSNLFFDGKGMHIRPTIVAEEDFGGDWDKFLTDGEINLGDQCTTDNIEVDKDRDGCSVKASGDRKSIANPVYSARINTREKHSIKFGRVEVVAKLPRGDWLWPAIWMLPVDNNKYGTGWPINGEIDIMEARGNAPSYPNGGNNVIRSTLNYGPLKTLVKSIFGWQEFKRTSLANGFHTYTMEWTHDFMRFYIDSRLHSMLLLDTKKKDFFSKGGFPATFQNGTDAQVVIENPWGADKKDGDGNKLTKTPTNAPFDQEFYLIINLAVGGTSGWFPDEVAEKPWYDKAESAMVDFAAAHEKWVPTWGKKESGERDFIIKSVKMEQSTRDGTC